MSSYAATAGALASVRRETLDALRRHVRPGEPAALLDFPYHQNAGDALIYLGERRYFHDLDVPLAYVDDLGTHDPATLRRRLPDGPLLLHGGGNFGDRWPVHQLFREKVIAAHPDRRIVQLPQSMEFRDAAALERTRRVYGGHPNLTLLLREQRSYDDAVSAFGDVCAVEYCPDLALGADIGESTVAPAVDVLKLLRTDSERVEYGDVHTALSSEEHDWGLTGDDAATWARQLRTRRTALRFPFLARWMQTSLRRNFDAQAELNVAAAQRVLARGRIVLTDRLHAAVLAGMMGRRVVALDNSYGKVSSIHRAYLHRLPNVVFVANAADAERRLEA